MLLAAVCLAPKSSWDTSRLVSEFTYFMLMLCASNFWINQQLSALVGSLLLDHTRCNCALIPRALISSLWLVSEAVRFMSGARVPFLMHWTERIVDSLADWLQSLGLKAMQWKKRRKGKGNSFPLDFPWLDCAIQRELLCEDRSLNGMRRNHIIQVFKRNHSAWDCFSQHRRAKCYQDYSRDAFRRRTKPKYRKLYKKICEEEPS